MILCVIVSNIVKFFHICKHSFQILSVVWEYLRYLPSDFARNSGHQRPINPDVYSHRHICCIWVHRLSFSCHQEFSSSPGCELHSNFVSLTDCKQRQARSLRRQPRCELHSNFVSLTDCKQPGKFGIGGKTGCELLSNFVSLTDCKQHSRSGKYRCRSCELLSNFVSLTDCKQL